MHLKHIRQNNDVHVFLSCARAHKSSQEIAGRGGGPYPLSEDTHKKRVFLVVGPPFFLHSKSYALSHLSLAWVLSKRTEI